MPVQGTQEALHSRARIDPSPAEARASWPLCTGYQAGARKGRRPHLFGEGRASGAKRPAARSRGAYFGGASGAHVDTPAPTIRKPTFVMNAVSTDPSLGR